ncbi:hypothetical protein WJX82_011746 [Trebouxia sp. C0006]
MRFLLAALTCSLLAIASGSAVAAGTEDLGNGLIHTKGGLIGNRKLLQMGVTTAACMLRDPCLLIKEARRWTAPTTTVVTTATRARAQSTQIMLDPQWAAPMTTPMAPCPITHTTEWDPGPTTDTAMEWDPCLTTALMMAPWDPCQTTALMMAPWDPCQTTALMMDQMVAHMKVQMGAQMGADTEALVEMEDMTCPWATRCRTVRHERG